MGLDSVDKLVSQKTLSQVDTFLENGDMKGALRLLKPLAVQGDVGSMFMMGYVLEQMELHYVDKLSASIEWYKRAASKGFYPAANNIGVLFRDVGDRRRALRWFWRAVELGDDDALLEIAKLYLANQRSAYRAKVVLQRLSCSEVSTEHGVEEANRLLALIKEAER